MTVHQIAHARELASTGRRDEAVAYLVAASTANQQSAALQVELGHLHLATNAFREADKCFLQALRIEPENATACLGRSAALLGLQRATESLAEIDTALHLEPGRAEFHTHRGHVLCRLGRLEDAERAYRHALDLDPTDATACFVLFHVLEHRQQVADAIVLLRRFAAENPTEIKLRLHLARLLDKSGQLPARQILDWA